MTRPRPQRRVDRTREHYTKAGKPKRSLSAREAAQSRQAGYKVYICSVCGAHHSGTPLGGVGAAE